ncbi:MAG: hypothetical protein IPH58_10475 [Sphingobacteriales bacterium]|jgi:hypothetical protein|nr:hypothetical protein [Sphingobacteriales bacterium]
MHPFFLSAITLFILAVLGISYFLPEKQEITKIITIEAPPEKIYNQLLSAQFFLSQMNQKDSASLNKTDSTQAVVGATLRWKEDSFFYKEAQIKLTKAIPEKEIDFNIVLEGIKNIDGFSKILLNVKDKATQVTWFVSFSTPRPWNVANLFYNLEKERGKDFENGLITLKLFSEAKYEANLY